MKLSKVNKHNGSKGGLLIALIFLFTTSVKAQSLPTGQAGEYPLNDPRNPKCPCHKYQQQAEEEYKQLLAQNNSLNNNKEIKLNNDKKFVGLSNDALGNKHHNSGESSLINQINPPKFNGVSADDLTRINIAEGDNILGNIKYEPGELIVSEQKIGRSGSYYGVKPYSTTKHWKGKHKRHTAFHKQLKRIFYIGGWDIWKRKKITSACYHWN